MITFPTRIQFKISNVMFFPLRGIYCRDSQRLSQMGAGKSSTAGERSGRLLIRHVKESTCTGTMINLSRSLLLFQFFIEEGQKKIESLKKQMHSMEEQQAIAMEHFSDEAFDRHVQEEVNKTKLVLKRYVHELSFYYWTLVNVML